MSHFPFHACSTLLLLPHFARIPFLCGYLCRWAGSSARGLTQEAARELLVRTGGSFKAPDPLAGTWLLLEFASFWLLSSSPQLIETICYSLTCGPLSKMEVHSSGSRPVTESPEGRVSCPGAPFHRSQRRLSGGLLSGASRSGAVTWGPGVGSESCGALGTHLLCSRVHHHRGFGRRLSPVYILNNKRTRVPISSLIYQ